MARPITSIADLRLLAKRRLPRAIFDYADRGSYDEVRVGRNPRDLDALVFRQRAAVDVYKRNLATTLVGQIPLARERARLRSLSVGQPVAPEADVPGGLSYTRSPRGAKVVTGGAKYAFITLGA